MKRTKTFLTASTYSYVHVLVLEIQCIPVCREPDRRRFWWCSRRNTRRCLGSEHICEGFVAIYNLDALHITIGSYFTTKLPVECGVCGIAVCHVRRT